jgi:hypothetical protein
MQSHGRSAPSLLEPGGRIVCLPSDLLTPYAKHCGRVGVSSSTIYNFDRVYCSTSGGHPLEFLEALFSFVSADTKAAPILQCECLSMAIRVVKSIKVDSKTIFNLRVSDVRIIDSILDLCGVKDVTKRRQVAKLFSRSNFNRATKDLALLGLSEVRFYLIYNQVKQFHLLLI